MEKVLYKTVTRRMLMHGAGVWCLHPTVRIARKVSSIQRGFLLAIIGACGTTPTAALQVILEISPLHLQLQLDASVTAKTNIKTFHTSGC
ncbi:hypothetical protein AVEN_73265-1 [Araneus ventricosus]|uniref:Uncharacterized protein n=1 Tax=Araneus ventricosus TaxID=182803 RepID=A0A4Y2F1S6_ARAVE|nr:hypothetical protein AVEN_73265-1 [Araneus ventricosus]